MTVRSLPTELDILYTGSKIKNWLAGIRCDTRCASRALARCGHLVFLAYDCCPVYLWLVHSLRYPCPFYSLVPCGPERMAEVQKCGHFQLSACHPIAVTVRSAVQMFERCTAGAIRHAHQMHGLLTGCVCCPLPLVAVGEFCPTSRLGDLLAFLPLWLTV